MTGTETLKKWIDESGRIVFFGGAGVSTESGVPDFRSKDGLYNRRGVEFEKYSPEYLLSHECLIYEPEVFFTFYRQKLDARAARPNAAHLYLATLEREGKLLAVVTQNIDGLHTHAGSENVFELHGATTRNYCMDCGKKYGADYIYNCPETVPRCACGGIIRPDVTLYGEALPEAAVEGAVDAISRADMLIIGGTSLTVYPAASFIGYFRGRHRVIINRDKLPFRLNAGRDLEINEPIAMVFSRLDRDTSVTACKKI